MNLFLSRRRCIGLTAGALWLISISYVFIIWSLVAIGTPTAGNILIGMLIVLIVFLAAGVIVLRAALALPKEIVERTEEEKKIGKKFAIVFGAEGIAFAVVNSILGITRNFALMPSLNLIIVGIHFLPLAKIFRVPRYLITGILFCLIPAATLILIPKEFIVGQTIAWYVVPSLGCGVIATLTGLAGLYEARQSINEIRRDGTLIR